ncbi:transposase [uncultured Fusobacterium sp.]|uniref:RNA-guided endonuclease InsQ/TnpB family protein n=1 Tax=uncultured Fusobacterium sp. TaxID=159267 RepID=UPI0025DA94B4|nr:transposase [uncultured Fusobacterium sp.]
MIRGYRIKIFPKEEQKKMIHKSFGCTRFIYNWCIDRISENYNKTKKTLSSIELQKEIVILKKQIEYSWLNEVSANMLKQVTIDCSNAYKKWFKLIKQNNNIKGKPRYKSRKSKQNCPTRTDRMTFNGRYVHLEKIGNVKLSKVKIDLDGKLMNARLNFDGIDYWLSFSVEYKDIQLEEKPNTEPIGIDLGLKTLVYCSNGNTYEKPHTKMIDKKIKYLQRKISKIYQPMIDYCKETRTKFSTLKKSNNLIKLEKELRKYQIRKTNILDSNIHRITSDLIKINPEKIVIEDLNVKGMMSNHKLARSIQSSKFYEIRRQLMYKCENNNIKLIVADRFYPSSKTCSSCGNIKDDLKLKDRVYRCPQCGAVIDRDLNAAINLSRIS